MTTTDPTAPATPGEALARLFHETYERLAPEHGYRTREESAKPWEDVPQQNRALMVATCEVVLRRWADEPDAARATDPAPATPPEHQPGARTYALPAEPSVGTHLWEEATGREWERTGSRYFPWRLTGVPSFGDNRYQTCSWTGVLRYGPLSTTPPPAGTEPASATAVDLPAGTVWP